MSRAEVVEEEGSAGSPMAWGSRHSTHWQRQMRGWGGGNGGTGRKRRPEIILDRHLRRCWSLKTRTWGQGKETFPQSWVRLPHQETPSWSPKRARRHRCRQQRPVCRRRGYPMHRRRSAAMRRRAGGDWWLAAPAHHLEMEEEACWWASQAWGREGGDDLTFEGRARLVHRPWMRRREG